jgi:hypothetical protein
VHSLTHNQAPDTSKLPKFGAPSGSEYGEILNQQEQGDRILPNKDSYAAFGSPDRFMDVDGQIHQMPKLAELKEGEHLPVDLTSLPKFGEPSSYLSDPEEK